MPNKRKRPFWLGIMLGLLLATLLVLIVIAPQTDQQPQPINLAQQPAPVMETTHAPPPVPILIPVQAQAQTSAQIQVVKKPTAPKSVLKGSPANPATSRHGIALILDDAGYDLDAVKRLLDLSVPIAISILPDAPFAHQSAILAKQAKQVVMLHLPMQPENATLRMGDDFLHVGMSEEDVHRTFLRNLEKIPYVEGVNNHMGSKLTQLDMPMRWVMQTCQEKGLFFVDSRTSARSIAAKVAKTSGLAWASRSIFLDHDMSLAAMQRAWQQARKCAAKKFRCIVIAHPRAKTITFLENYLTREDAANMVSIKQLLQTTPINPPTTVSRLP